MGNFGASYFGKDQEAAQWAQIAGIASRMNDKFEKEHISSAYETLKNGESLPDDTRDSIKVNATKLLRDNLEGETVAAEQQIMADLTAKSKEQGVGINDYLRNNVESYLTTPASYRAVGNISKMFQERQLADASYQKAKIEEGVLRYKEVSSLVEAADGLYQKGDMDGARKMVEQFSKILPVPGYLKTNDETGDLEGYATDLKDGGHKPSGQKYDVRGMIDAAKSVSRDEFALGYAMNSHVIRETNAKNLQDAVIMKDDKGGRYMGFNFVDPYDATDTKFVVKQYGTGKDVGRFASVHDAVDGGFTPYNQKYEKGELDIENEKRQGRNLDLSARNLSLTGQGLGLDNMYKKLRNEEQDVQTDIAIRTKDDVIRKKGSEADEKLFDSYAAMYNAQGKEVDVRDKKADFAHQESGRYADVLNAASGVGGFYNGKPSGSGEGSEGGFSAVAPEHMITAKKVTDRLRDMGIDNSLIPGFAQEVIKRAAQTDTDKGARGDSAIWESIAAVTGKKPEEVELYNDDIFRRLPPDEQAQVVNRHIQEKQKQAEAADLEAFRKKGQKELSDLFESVESRYNFYKSGQGYGNHRTEDEMMRAAIAVYADDLADAQEKYYKDMPPEEFIRKIKAAVSENINNRRRKTEESEQQKNRDESYKSERKRYVDSLVKGIIE